MCLRMHAQPSIRIINRDIWTINQRIAEKLNIIPERFEDHFEV